MKAVRDALIKKAHRHVTTKQDINSERRVTLFDY